MYKHPRLVLLGLQVQQCPWSHLPFSLVQGSEVQRGHVAPTLLQFLLTTDGTASPEQFALCVLSFASSQSLFLGAPLVLLCTLSGGCSFLLALGFSKAVLLSL